MRDDYIHEARDDLWLSGFENSDGKSCFYNFILSNGDRTEQASALTMKDHMIPDGKSVKKVQIFCNNVLNIEGFQFFDRDGNVVFKIGRQTDAVSEVELQDDEQIIGFKAKLYKHFQAVYSDFQFMIVRKF